MRERNILLAGLLGGLLLIGLVETYTRFHQDSFSNEFTKTRESIVLQRQLALAQRKTPARVLFLGDSTVGAAIDDEAFERASGIPCMNLGLNGSLVAYSEYFMLRQYLAKFEAPEAVVVWHTMDVWQRDLDLSEFSFTQPTLEDRMAAIRNSLINRDITLNIIYWPVKEPSEILRSLFFAAVESYRYKVWIKRRLAKSVPGLDPVTLVSEMPSEHSDPANHIQSELSTVGNLRIYVSKDNRYWFAKFMALAREHHIRVLVSRSPVQVSFIQNPKTKTFLNRLAGTVDEALASYPELEWLTRDYMVFAETESHGDKDHVNEVGRARLTRFLAKRVKQALKK